MAETPLSSFERCCRLCAEEQEVSIMIFSAEAEAILLRNKLNKYLLIEVDEDDKLPKNICIKCCTKLQTVCEFIDTTQKAQEVLINRSLMLDQLSNECMKTLIKSELSHVENIVTESKYTEMEVSVDPMMVLQNSEESLSPYTYENCIQMEDVTHLHGIDGENVTLKLIKKEYTTADLSDNKKDANLKPFPCVTCKRSFYTELALKNHSWIHINENKDDKQYKCGTCKEVFNLKCAFITHLKQHKFSNGICQLCGRMFRTERTYTAHMAVHMSSGKSFTCKICGRSYNTWGSLRTHSVTHSSERPYQCPFCKKSFKRNQDLKFHINQHTGAKPYKCPFCDKCFASSGNCYSHRSRMHPGKCVEGKVRRWNTAPKENQIIAPRPIAPKSHLTNVKGIFKYQCQICEHSFMRRDNFTYHIYQHTGEKPFQCSYCTEKFVTRRGLLIHHDKEHSSKDRPLALLSKNALLK